ncbi:LysR family transcriptional regulator [Teichococcus cervicalis]|uniref:HTH-type transcriptional activator AmpR n=1 Tax=Pseudoroseomonas cervicalis ATCC 49957 TaxID=525371 RepID=D5RSM9_9PROT|nr:LysR family transcriptional regulator [Pseudoroseomonas cervicalis]EFH09691.1 HTH-type transcriptional activator AmpR [Pseudoroseomonas cervicalis ATCC 49957]
MNAMRSHLPLNALRAFEASARHLSFTKAGLELHVTQAAISHQVKSLEENLGVALFRRLPRGLALTDEGAALLPEIAEGFRRIGRSLDRFEAGQVREVLTVGVVGSLAVGWLLPRLERFRQAHPFIDLRLLTNNNRVDLAGEGLDCAIRFGDGAWHGTEAVRLFSAPLSPACAPGVAARLRRPEDLAGEVLLRSYRADEWPRWFASLDLPCPPPRGMIADSSLVLAEAAAQGAGVALLPLRLFPRELAEGRLLRPFAAELSLGAYWLSWLRSRPPGPALRAFQFWLLEEAQG